MITIEPPEPLPEDDDDLWSALRLSRRPLTDFLRRARITVGVAGQVDVLLAGDRTVRRLNREFRGKDKTTDVLSFAAAEDVAAEHAGDVAISVEAAARQAREYGHSLRDEVRVLLLHGLLHLSGMDHEMDRGEMAAREAALRRQLRLPGGLIERVEASAGGSSAGLGRSGFPSGMTNKKATATATATTTTRAKAKAKAGLRPVSSRELRGARRDGGSKKVTS